jgi:hypothetical protein
MARRGKRSSGNLLKPMLQAVICAIGLACGVSMGSFIIYVGGLLNDLGRVVGKPLDEITIVDLLVASAPFVVVIACGWLGTWWGMRLADKLEM